MKQGGIVTHIFRKKEETRKGVQQVMGGHVLESWKEEMIRIGRTEVLAEQQNKLEMKVCAKIRKGKTAVQIAEELEEDISVILPVYERFVGENG